MKKPLIIAHRGESYDAPENTMAAIDLAWERGSEAVEIDVHLSQDDEVVVIHDYNTNRLGGVNKKVKDQTLEELERLDVGSWKNSKWEGEKIPTLNKVLNAVPNGKKLIIEIKSEAKIVPFIKSEIKESNLRNEQIELIGFDIDTMSIAKKAFPAHKVLWLLDLDYIWFNRIFKPSIAKAIRKAKQFQLDGLNVWAGKQLDKEMIDQVHNAGLLLYCWTVDDVNKARKLLDWGIDAITTNRTEWMKSALMKKP